MATEMKISIDNTYMNVIRFGNGHKNMVIIAGISLCGLEGKGEAIASAYQRFENAYTVYVMDRKKELPANAKVEDMADDICRVLEQLDITTADFYGVSQGGMIAQCIAIHHPLLVHRLVLCSTLCKTTPSMKQACSEWIRLANAGDIVGINRSFFKLVYSEAYLKKYEEFLPALEQEGSPEDCRRFLTMVKACETFDVTGSINMIRCPVLVIGDSNDQVTGIDGSRQLTDLLGCPMQLYTEYSHAVYDEASDITEHIANFLMSSGSQHN